MFDSINSPKISLTELSNYSIILIKFANSAHHEVLAINAEFLFEFVTTPGTLGGRFVFSLSFLNHRTEKVFWRLSAGH